MAETIIAVVLLIYVLIGVKWETHRRKNRSISHSNTPILLSYYTSGNAATRMLPSLMPIEEGKIGDMNYTAFLANFGSLISQSGSPTSVLFRIELPFATSIHLVGIPKHSKSQLNPTFGSSIMEPLVLEGDYINHFTLYCEKDMQSHARYVLDPKAMAFTVDFCQSHSWEIVGNELYFVQPTNDKTDRDPTPMRADIEKFVAEIRPAVERPLTTAELRAITPYGKDRRERLPCPICRSDMDNNGRFYACPAHHGVLLTGANLIDAKNGTLALPSFSQPQHSDRCRKLSCPSCGNAMNHVDYNGSGVMIDSCSECVYRWIDNGELQPLIIQASKMKS